MSRTKVLLKRNIGLFMGRLLTYLYVAKLGKTYHKMIIPNQNKKFHWDSVILSEKVTKYTEEHHSSWLTLKRKK